MLRSYMEQIQNLVTSKERKLKSCTSSNAYLMLKNEKILKRNKVLWFFSIVTGLQWVFLTILIVLGYIDVTYNF